MYFCDLPGIKRQRGWVIYIFIERANVTFYYRYNDVVKACLLKRMACLHERAEWAYDNDGDDHCGIICNGHSWREGGRGGRRDTNSHWNYQHLTNIILPKASSKHQKWQNMHFGDSPVFIW